MTVVRFLATVVGCSLGGFAGAVLIVGQLGFFNTNITAGRGWIALALVIFGRWRPVWIVAGAVLFGALDALQFRFQTLDSVGPVRVLHRPAVRRHPRRPLRRGESRAAPSPSAVPSRAARRRARPRSGLSGVVPWISCCFARYTP